MNNNAKSCWEFWECSKKLREKCPVYRHDIGDSCWSVHTLKPVCVRLKKTPTCVDCEWYKKHNKI